MRAAAWKAPETFELVDVPTPEPAAGQLVLEVASCGICGSDLHSFRRGFAAQPGQILGHEFCGTVAAAPGVDGVERGDRVTVRPLLPCGECERCQAGELQLCERGGYDANIGYGLPGAFAQRVLVPRAILGETVFLLPTGVDDRAGALVEPLSVALHAVNLAAAAKGDAALVLGAGAIGLGVTRMLALREVGTIVVADPSRLRRERAGELGADVLIDPSAEDVIEVVRSITGAGTSGLGAAADVAIDCAGVPGTFIQALQAARTGGVIVLAALYSDKVEFRPNRIVEKELSVRGSFAYRDEFASVVEMLADGRVDADSLISHVFPLEEIDEAFRVQLDPESAIKVLVSPMFP
jgi:2-desacetyl-2-hydroxyethyl bacteriochlorophyllide A dehydrogenase